MLRLLVFFSILFSFQSAAIAQPDTSHLRISLLTCGTGLQAWETFGHSGIRITDSVRGTDNVYNYGTFNGYDENFVWNFTRGKLLYYLSYYSFRQFILEYQEAGRSVTEQELLLPGAAKQALYEYLVWNARDENKYYKYDFFFDNCATRIRDVFSRALGKKFVLGRAIDKQQHMSFRDIINQYFYRVHWQRLGVNILLGRKVDRVMSNEDIMFLPDYLQKGIATSTYKGKSIAGPVNLIVPQTLPAPAGTNWPFWVMVLVMLLTFTGLLFKKFEVFGKVMSFLLLLISGLLGWFVLFMWFGTDHQACQNNYSLLWAVPTNLLLAFAPKRNKNKYALVAMLLLFAALVLHLLHIQQMPLLELSPLLLSLLLVYGTIYRKSETRNH